MHLKILIRICSQPAYFLKIYSTKPTQKRSLMHLITFFICGWFPGSPNLITIPQGEIPKFLKDDNVIQSDKLYENFNTNNVVVLSLFNFSLP